MRVFEIRPDKTLTDEEISIVKNAKNVFKTFLAGTIEMGNSVDWQRNYINEMITIVIGVNAFRSDDTNFNPNDDVMIFYNPRRNEATKDLEAQINWELDALEECDSIYMNLEANSKSPISLLELGLFARSGKLRVTCPKEFYRYDNVRITCNKYNVPFRTDKNEKFEPCVK